MTFDVQFESLNDISVEFRINKQAICLGLLALNEM